jgi:transcriptional regulator with GAF, ATPase, and Fis domain
LVTAIAAGAFRQDLYYRLNVFPIALPPLRSRPEDIALLVHYFVSRFAAKIGRKIARVPHETMQRLAAYSWPGNVRELENVIERAVILSSGPELHFPSEMLLEIAPTGLPTQTARADLAPLAAREEPPSEAVSLEDVERAHIVTVLERTHWRIDGPQGAARILNLNPSTLRSRLKKLRIQRGSHPVSS